MRTLAALVALQVALGAPVRAEEPAKAAAGGSAEAGPVAIPEGMAPDGRFRAARWGMSVDELVKALAGEAKALEKPVTLKDGNVVAAAIPELAIAGQPFAVRFVFEKGKLALVSLRTPEGKYAEPASYQRLARGLGERFGGPGEETKDQELFDLRQTRWRLPASQVDLKYIPGVVVVLYSPPAGR